MNWISSKFKTSGLSDDTVKRMRKQARDWEKIFPQNIFGKRLASRIQKELSNFSD